MATRKQPLRTALLAGASGLIGAQLLALLRDHPAYRHTHLLLRRPMAGVAAYDRITPHIVDYGALPDPLPEVDDVYIALGTTIKSPARKRRFVASTSTTSSTPRAPHVRPVRSASAWSPRSAPTHARRCSTTASRGRCRTRSARSATTRS
jgi:hypothetical protein